MVLLPWAINAVAAADDEIDLSSLLVVHKPFDFL
jgi:hypothetical protein